MITLRDDQNDVLAKLRVALRTFTSVLVYAPTGFGKTVLASKVMRSIFDASKRVIFCVHRVDLIVQTAKTLTAFGVPFSYIASGQPYNSYHRVFIASIATLKNRLGKIPADYVIVDEAHLSAASGWAKVAHHYLATGAKLIGLSGSPERLDGKPLKDVWQVMVEGPSVAWLIENGFLSKYRAFAPAGVDMTGVHTRHGEYVSTEVEELMKGKAVLAGAVNHWRKLAHGKRTIAFAPSVASSETLAAEFRANGVNATALDGETPQSARWAAFIDFAERRLDVIVNCALFCEGFDLSAQVDRDVTVEAVVQYSPTKSLAKHLQQLGRGLRKKPEPAILIDLVGNFGRHGLPDDEREWSLEGRKNTGQEVSTMICPECFAAHSPAPACPECGHRYTPKQEREGGSRGVIQVNGDLEEIDAEKLKRQKQREQQQARTLDDLISLATARGYKSPEKWAAHIFTARAAKRGEMDDQTRTVGEANGVLNQRELARMTGVNHNTIHYWIKTGVITPTTYDATAKAIKDEAQSRIVKAADVARKLGRDRSVVAGWARNEGMPLTSVEAALEWAAQHKATKQGAAAAA